MREDTFNVIKKILEGLSRLALKEIIYLFNNILELSLTRAIAKETAVVRRFGKNKSDGS